MNGLLLGSLQEDAPPERGFTLKGKNVILEEQNFPFKENKDPIKERRKKSI